MSHYSLEEVFAFPSDYLTRVLEGNGLTNIKGDLNRKLLVTLLFQKAGMIRPEDLPIVNHKDFKTLYLLDDQELRHRSGMNWKQNRFDYIRAIIGREPETPPEEEDLLSENKELIDIFNELGALYTLEGDTYRAKTFFHASEVVSQMEERVTTTDQMEGIAGIGPSTIEVVDIFLRTGMVPRLEELRSKISSEKESVLELFSSVWGFGMVTALDYYKQGYRTLEDLKKAPTLTSAQKVGLLHYDDLQRRIPRAEIDEVKKIISEALKDLPLTWMIAGSYARLEPDSGDVDILVRRDDGVSLGEIVKRLKDISLLIDDLANGVRKYMGVARLSPIHHAFQVDIRVFNKENWVTAKLYNVGSSSFNVLFRQRALEKGLSLNEYNLTTLDGTPLPVETEEDVFKYLSVPYLEPWERVRGMTRLP